MTRTVTRRELVAALDENQTALSRRAARESWPYTEYLCRGGRRRHYLVAALPPDVQAALADQAAPPAPPAPPADPPLLDRSTPARRGRPQAAVPDAAWQAWLADYLDRRQPTAQSCYRRLQAQAASEGWTLPSLRTLRRRLAREIDPAVVTLRREGAPAVARRYPAQTRTVAGLHALEWINGDGYQPRPNLRWADGTISRPVIWWWQDVHSRKLLAWALDKSENADLIRLTLADLIATWGLPAHVTLDNTRAAANKTLSGQVPHRYRHGPPRWDEPLGLLPRLGIEVHWTGVVEGQGWGQAKPVERAHRDLRQDLDKHPALRAAWERAHAVPRAAYEDIVADVVHEYNGRPGRRTEMGAGAHSFDSVFARSYERATIRWPSDTQRRLLLLVPEVAIVDPAGGVALRAGRGPHGHNRYQHPALLAHTGARICVRYDPAYLHADVECETLAGQPLCSAACVAPVGYGDTAAGRRHSRARRQYVTATKKAAAALVQVHTAARPAPPAPSPRPRPGALRLVEQPVPARDPDPPPAPPADEDRLVRLMQTVAPARRRG